MRKLALDMRLVHRNGVLEETTDRFLWGACACSLVLHGLFVALAPAHRPLPTFHAEPMEISVVQLPPPAAVAPVVPEPLAVQPTQSPTQPLDPSRTRQDPTTQPNVAQTEPAGAVIDPGPAQPVQPATTAATPSTNPNLPIVSPLAVAAAYVDSDPSGVPVRTPGGTTDRSLSQGTRPSDAEISRRFAEGLGREVAASSHAVFTRREPPRLVPQADGSLAYQGSRFAARINRDGSVTFNDRANVQVDWAHGSMGFDINDAIDRGRGLDPLAPERRWFLEQTEELRDRLAREAGVAEAGRTSRRIQGRLRRLWNDPEKTVAERRRAIFTLWGECDATGEDGRAARRAIEQFVRTELPANESNAYTRQELDALNGQRQAADRFDPYH